MTDSKSSKERLTEIARVFSNDQRIEVDENFVPESYGISLREILEDPQLGEKAVIKYWEFKKAGGFE